MKKINSISEFESAIKEGHTLVDFYTEWCGPCKVMEPVLTNLEKTSDNVKIFKVDVDLHEALANQFGLHSVPTLILFENGKELRRVSGFQSQVALEKFIK